MPTQNYPNCIVDQSILDKIAVDLNHYTKLSRKHKQFRKQTDDDMIAIIHGKASPHYIDNNTLHITHESGVINIYNL